MSRRVKDGRPTGERGKVSAEAIRNALGLGGPEPETRPPKLSPAQQREVEAGRDPGPTGGGDANYETTIIKGGRDAFEHFGRPDIGSAEAHLQDGRPVASEPPPKAQPQRADWNSADGAINGPSPEDSAAELRREAETLRREAQQHVANTAARVKAAADSGDEAAKASAREDAAKAIALGERVKKFLGAG